MTTTTIRTISGKEINFANLDSSEWCVEDIGHALSTLNRFTGHTKRMYTVAEHTLWVSLLVPPEAAFAGLHHDDSEAYLNDLNRPLKYMESMSGYKTLEKDVEKRLCIYLGIDDCYTPSVKKWDDIIGTLENYSLRSPFAQCDMVARQWAMSKYVDLDIKGMVPSAYRFKAMRDVWCRASEIYKDYKDHPRIGQTIVRSWKYPGTDITWGELIHSNSVADIVAHVTPVSVKLSLEIP